MNRDTASHAGAARAAPASPPSASITHRLPRRRRARRWTASGRSPRRCSARSSRWPPRSPARSATPSTASASLGDGQDEADRLAQENAGAAAAGCARASSTAPAPQELDALLQLAGAGRYRVVPGAGHRDRRGPELLLDRHHRRRQPRRHPRRHDGAQRRRPGRPGQDRRPDDRHRAARRRPRRRRSGSGWRARSRSASPPARASATAATWTSSCSTAQSTVAERRPAGDLRLAGRHAVRARRAGRARSSRVQARPGSQTRAAVVGPYVDFTALDLVGVVVEPPRTDPRDAVLPPTPAGHADADGHRDRDAVAERGEADRAGRPHRARRRPGRRRPGAAGHAVLAGSRCPARRRTCVLLVVVGAGARLRARLRAGHAGSRAGLATDLVPPADHEVGRWALVLTLVGYLAGLGRRRAAAVRRSCRWWSSRSPRRRRCCCTPGSVPCWTTRTSPGPACRACCRPRSSTTWC